MSIKIEIDAATGAEAREQMLGLLGMGGAIVINTKAGTEEQKETFKTEVKAATEEQPAQEPETTKKRRTKAEIEADKKAVVDNEPDTSQEPAGPVDAEQAAKDKEAIDAGATAEFPTLPELQRACAVLVRAGYKKEGIDMVKNIGGAETSKDVPEDKRQVLIDALTKFAEDNKIAL